MLNNAYRTLRTSLVAAVALLLLSGSAFSASTHTVQRGETLYTISKKYSTTVPVLQRLNHLGSPNRIKVGQKLVLPPNNLPKPGESTTYGISRKNGLQVWQDDTLVSTLKKDSRFQIIEREGDKFQVKLSDGKTGWVMADSVTVNETRKPLPATTSYSASRGSIVGTALACRGARYRRGGTGARGYDCSGLVMSVYAKHGVKLPHSAAAQFKRGVPVSKSELQAGDLVFFSNTYRRGISHVGIYVGDGKFIHAATSRRGVRVDDLNAAYYRRKYAGARRLT